MAFWQWPGLIDAGREMLGMKPLFRDGDWFQDEDEGPDDEGADDETEDDEGGWDE